MNAMDRRWLSAVLWDAALLFGVWLVAGLKGLGWACIIGAGLCAYARMREADKRNSGLRGDPHMDHYFFDSSEQQADRFLP